MIRRVLTIVASLLLCVAVVGCESGGSSDDAPKGRAQRPVTTTNKKPPGAPGGGLKGNEDPGAPGATGGKTGG